MSFARELVINALRLGARVALTMHRVTLAEMKELMGVALYRELEEEGGTQSQMALQLGCSVRAVRDLKTRSERTDQEQVGQSSLFVRLIDRLREGVASELELTDLVPRNNEICMGDRHALARIALSILERKGLVEKTKQRSPVSYCLTDAWEEIEEVGWHSPLAAIEQAYREAIDLTDILHARPLTLAEIDQLRPSSWTDILELRQILTTLVDVGRVERIPAQGRRKEQYSIPDALRNLAPEDRPTKLKIHLDNYLHKCRRYIDYVLKSPHSETNGGGTFVFNAPADRLYDIRRGVKRRLSRYANAVDSAAELAPSKASLMIVYTICPFESAE